MMSPRTLSLPLALAAGLLSSLPARAQAPAAPAPAAAPAPVPAAGKAQLVQEGCIGCHGGPGAAGAVAVPGLAGRDAQELRALMTAFRANERPATIMNRIVRGYSDEELAAAADYFSKLKP
jgi:sulfide dehydrogenase cytochrome subunit